MAFVIVSGKGKSRCLIGGFEKSFTKCIRKEETKIYCFIS